MINKLIHKTILGIAGVFLIGIQAFGQADPFELVSGVSSNVTVCGDSVEYHLYIKNNSYTPVVGGGIYTLKTVLPEGINYVSGSVSKDAIENDISNPNQPVFEINYMTPGDIDTIIFKGYATCELIDYIKSTGSTQATVTNLYTLFYNGSQVFQDNSESYNVAYADLEIFVADGEINVYSGVIEDPTNNVWERNAVHQRHITIKNSGYGALSSFTFKMSLNDGLLYHGLRLSDTTHADSIDLSYVSSTNNEFIFTIDDFSLIGDGDEFFEQDEVLLLTDSISVIACGPSLESNYSARWGCYTSTCNADDREAEFSAYISIISSASLFANSFTILDSADLCGDLSSMGVWHLKNKGRNQNVDGADAAYDVYLQFGSHVDWNVLDSFIIRNQAGGVNVNLDTVITPSVFYQSSGTRKYYRFYLKDLFTYDPDGPGYGLEDVDGDGFYDDIPVLDNGLRVEVYSTLDTNSWHKLRTCRNGHRLYHLFLDSRSYYNCSDRNDFYLNPGGSTRNVAMRHSNVSSVTPPEIFGNNDLKNGETDTYKFRIRHAVTNGVIKPGGKYISEITVPDGFLLQGARWIETYSNLVPRFTHVIQDAYIHRDGNNYIIDTLGGQYGYYELDFKLDCDSAEGTSGLVNQINWVMKYYYCPEKYAVVGCASFDIYNHCPSCGIYSTNFDVERTTFGWYRPNSAEGSGSLSNHYYYPNELYGTSQFKIDYTNIDKSLYQLNKVYPTDTVKVSVTGEVLPGEQYDTIGVRISYISPLNTNNENLFDLLPFGQKGSSLVIDGITYPVLQSYLNTTFQSGKKVLMEFKVPISGGYTNNTGDTVDADFELYFRINEFNDNQLASSPNQRLWELNAADFRAEHFGIEPDDNQVGCVSFGKTFFYCKPYIHTSVYNTNSSNNTGAYTCNDKVRYLRTRLYATGWSNEYRPLFYTDDIRFQIPQGYNIKKAYINASRINSGNRLNYYVLGEDALNSSYSPIDSMYTLPKESLPVFNERREVYYYIEMQPDCEGGSFEQADVTARNDMRDNKVEYDYYTRAYRRHEPEHIQNHFLHNNKVIYDRRNVELGISANEVQEGYASTVRWPIRVFRKDYDFNYVQNAENGWVAIELRDDDNSTQLEWAYDRDGNAFSATDVKFYGPTIYLPNGSARGKYMMVNLGTLNVNGQDFQVEASYRNCQDDVLQEIDVFASWSCYGYPITSQINGSIIDYGALDCEHPVTKDTLYLRYKTANMQWIVDRLVDTADLCDTVHYEILITSSKYANMQDLQLTLTVPEGVFFSTSDSSIFVEYPAGSGNWQVLPKGYIQPNGSIEYYFLNFLSQNNGELPGTRLPGENQIKVHFGLITSCAMDAGDLVDINLFGRTNCNDPIDLTDERIIPLRNIPIQEVKDNLTLDLTIPEFGSCEGSENVSRIHVVKTTGYALPPHKLTFRMIRGVRYVGVENGTPQPDTAYTRVINGIIVDFIEWDLTSIPDSLNYYVRTKLDDLSNLVNNLVVYSSNMYMNANATCVASGSVCDLRGTTVWDTEFLEVGQLPGIHIVGNDTVCSNVAKEIEVQLDGITDYSLYSFEWSPSLTPVAGTYNHFILQDESEADYMLTIRDVGIDTGTCVFDTVIRNFVYPNGSFTKDPVASYGISCNGRSDGRLVVNYELEEPNNDWGVALYEVRSMNSAMDTSSSTIPYGLIITADSAQQQSYEFVIEDTWGCRDSATFNVGYGGPTIGNICTERMGCGETTADVGVDFIVNVGNHPSFTTYNAGVKFTGALGQNLDFGVPQSGTLYGVGAGSYELFAASFGPKPACLLSKPFTIQNMNFNISRPTNPDFYKLCFDGDTRDVRIGVSDNLSNCTDDAGLSYDFTLYKDGLQIYQASVDAADSGSYLFTGLDSGLYVVDVVISMDGYPDCFATDTFRLDLVGDFRAEVTTTDPTCAYSNDGSAQALVFGGSGNYQYNWFEMSSPGNTLSNGYEVGGLSAGIQYGLTVSDENCPNPVAVPVLILSAPDPVLVTATDDGLDCNAEASAIGGTGPYTFHWVRYYYDTTITEIDTIIQYVVATEYSQSGVTTSNYNDFEEGKYLVKAVDSKGCIGENDTLILRRPTFDVSYSICMGWKTPAAPVSTPTSTLNSIEGNVIDATNSITSSLESQVEDCLNKQKEALEANYEEACLNADYVEDELGIEYDIKQHHYTLYYYDRAGNLVRTVPPEGVNLITTKDAEGHVARIPTSHEMITNYNYNSLAQLEGQETPDGGSTAFVYNAEGQLRFSQDAQQATEGLYSYTNYDELGRIVEVGEASGNFGALNEDDVTPNANKLERTTTVYSEKAEVDYLDQTQRYLTNRVSYSTTQNHDGQKASTYYSYDPHGNVEWLIQEIPGLGRTTTEYKYDLISGNVKQVIYNKGRADQWMHRYSYDGDNRLLLAETSKDGYIWEKDANYNYYLHGPLERAEIGEDKIQGQDYVYTLQGWLKGVNTPNAAQATGYNADGGNDFARDEFGMMLSYYDGDFKRGSTLNGDNTNPFHISNGRDLYNGNISAWVSTVSSENELGSKGTEDYTTAQTYTYDRLNRIKAADIHVYDVDGSQYQATSNEYGKTRYSYDANGNILSLDRYQADGTTLFDELDYHYEAGTNKLLYVDDASADGLLPEDIDDQDADNYAYDAEGNMIRDIQEGLTIKWNVFGKVAEVIPDEKTIDEQKPHIVFTYDATGNRIKKWVNRRPVFESGLLQKEVISDPTMVKTQYYSRDASGNVMAIYERTDSLVETITVTECDTNLTANVTYDATNNGGNCNSNNVLNYTDGVVTYNDPQVLQIPDSIEVVDGNAGDQSMTVSYLLENGNTVVISYTGGGKLERMYNCDSTLKASVDYTDLQKAKWYYWCTDCGNTNIAGSYISDVVSITVHVTLGDVTNPALKTEVMLPICTQDSVDIYEAEYSVIERPIYGSDRVGQLAQRVKVGGKLYREGDVINNEELVINNTNQSSTSYNANVLLTTLDTVMVDSAIYADSKIYTTPTVQIEASNFTAIQNLAGTVYNLAIAEDRTGILDYYAVTANYMNQENTLLLFDASNNLIGNSTGIKADQYSRPVFIRKPNSMNYYLITRGTDEAAYYHEIDKSGNTVISKNNVISTNTIGRNFAIIEEEPKEVTYLYLTSHDKINNQSTLQRVNIASWSIEDMVTFASYDSTGRGQIEINPTGKEIAIYNHNKAIGWFNAAEAEVLTYSLNSDYEVVGGTQTIYAMANNAGAGRLNYSSDGTGLYYVQNSLTNDATIHNQYGMISNNIANVNQTVDRNYQYNTADGAIWNERDAIAYRSTTLTPNTTGDIQANTAYAPHRVYDENWSELLLTRNVGLKLYELKDHLGNIRVVVADDKTFDGSDLVANVVAYNNYLSFGMQVPQRTFSASSYRYGFNGMEKDDELKGSGNSYTTLHRIYDSRIGRWMSPDPFEKKLSSWSSFQYSFNNPLFYVDTRGNIPYPVALKWIKNKKFVWGKQPGISNNNQEYGWRASKNRMHYGIDFNIGSGSDDLGIPLLNLADGKVLESGSTGNGGNYIIIRHGNGYITRYFHMQEKPTLKAGDKVKEGHKIGKIGGTYGYPVHGHLEMAKVPDANVTDKEALKQFKSEKYHFNPRDIIGQGTLGNGTGDLQVLSTQSSFDFTINYDFTAVSDAYSNLQVGSTLQLATYSVTGDGVYFRDNAGGDSNVIGAFNTGDQVFITGNTSDGWTEVVAPGGETGWISSSYIKKD